MKILYSLGISFLSFACGTKIFGQVQDSVLDRLANRLENYSRGVSPATLFVHFDKTVYTTAENVWFTGYLLNNSDHSGQDYAMGVGLVRNADRSVLYSSKFLLYNDVSHGNIFLPDSLPTGNYTLIAYTNTLVNGYPTHVFMQPVTIKAGQTKIVATLQLADSVKAGVDSVRVLLNARTKDIRMIAGASVKYWLGDSAYHIVKGEVRTDGKGDAFMMVPVNRIREKENVFTAQLQYQKETKTLRLVLPVPQKKIQVRFYPEGGNIINGLDNHVGVEVTSAGGNLVSIKAVLYVNDQPGIPIQTDIHGIGIFNFHANMNNKYRVKLMSDNDTATYALPQILPAGTVIQVADVLAEDTLYAKLTSSYAGKITVLIHNFKELFSSVELNTAAYSTRNVLFDLKEAPKGLAALTILDSTGIPVAERIFFAHYKRDYDLSITTDSSVYSKRGKVAVKLKLTGIRGEPFSGVVSFACVQGNRLDPGKMTDIEDYLYLDNELAAIPFKKRPMEDLPENRDFLNKLLLVKSWRRYTWHDALTNVIDTIVKRPSLQFTGTIVTDYGKRVKKKIQMGLLTHGKLNFFETDPEGNFTLSAEQTISDTSKNMLFIVGGAQSTHAIRINDPYEDMNKKLAGVFSFKDDIVTPVEMNTQSLALKDDEFTHILPTVIVQNSSPDHTIYLGTCGDYVCMYNVLNCFNHHYGLPPVDGETYKTSLGRSVVYHGNCGKAPNDKRFLRLAGITEGKQFYSSDYAEFNPPDPEYLSTVYWNYSVLIKNGEASLSFYTGDIAGKFRIVAQGVSGVDNVIYGEQSFSVKP